MERSPSEVHRRGDAMAEERNVSTPIGHNKNPIGRDLTARLSETQSQPLALDQLSMKPMMRRKDGTRTSIPSLTQRGSSLRPNKA